SGSVSWGSSTDGIRRRTRYEGPTGTAYGRSVFCCRLGAIAISLWWMASAGCLTPARPCPKRMGSAAATVCSSMRANGPKACNADVPASSNEQEHHGGRVPSGTGFESEPADERAIIARCLAGERAAYALLVERYKGLVHDLVCRMIGDAMEADDVAQEAFV